MKRSFLLFILTIPFCLSAQEIEKADALVSPKISEVEITVGGVDADVSGHNNRSIQFAIDAVELTGGTVRLNPGMYEINAPVRLKSNVDLVGSGKETVLKRGKGVQTKYLVDADYGELKLTVENADGFAIGMKVQVTDNENSGCWNVSTAYITDISDKVIYIDKGLIRDYRSDQNGGEKTDTKRPQTDLSEPGDARAEANSRHGDAEADLGRHLRPAAASPSPMRS